MSTTSFPQPAVRICLTGRHFRRLLRLLRTSVAARIVAISALMQLALFAGLLLHNATLIDEAIREGFEHRIDTLRPLLNAALAAPLVQGDYDTLRRRLEDLRDDEDLVYLVVRDARDSPVAFAGWRPGQEVPLASTRIPSDGRIYHTYVLIEASGRKYGTLNFGIATERMWLYHRALITRGIALIALGMLLFGGIQVWLSYRLALRLRRATVASEEVARGNYCLRIDDAGEDELARLAAAMNAMSRAIREKVARLERSEDRLQLAMEAGEVVVWEYDLAQNRYVWGRNAKRVLGALPAGATQHSDLPSLVHPEDRPQLASAHDIAVATKSGYRCDVRIVAVDGGVRWLALRGKLLKRPDANRMSLIGVARDITAGKRAEMEIRRLNEQLEDRVRERTLELEKAVQELEAFSYTVSHDLRAPLRALAGFSSLLRQRSRGGTWSDDAEHCLDRIQANAESMSRLIDDLLAFSRAGRFALTLEEVQPAALVGEVLRDQEFPELKRADVRVHEMPTCLADRSLLRQVYVNLISNALKYSRAAEHPCVEIGARQDNGSGTVYYVRDNGVGFDMKHSHKLFRVFQRLHTAQQYEGTGVGLAIVQRIVERHCGTITASGAPGRGAEFRFSLGGQELHRPQPV